MISHSIAACLGFIQKNKKFLKFPCIWYIMNAAPLPSKRPA